MYITKHFQAVEYKILWSVQEGLKPFKFVCVDALTLHLLNEVRVLNLILERLMVLIILLF